MKICLFGIYDPAYSRNRVIIKGLRDNGVEVIECQDRTSGPVKYLKLIIKYFKLKKDFDYLLVAFPGQAVMFLAKLISRKKIIFDCFTSHYQGLVEDRKVIKKNSWQAKINFWLDKYSCLLADYVLLDTNEHIKYFFETFNLNKEKFYCLYVGADDTVFYPKDEPDNRLFTVHWHGYYIPLQGVDTIIKAADILKNEQIIFNLIGRGQEYLKIKKLAEEYGLRNVNFIDKVGYQELAKIMSQADVCLGIFGTTKKTNLVIPNKVYEALAQGKPLITAETPAVKELLRDNDNVLFCQAGDAKGLVEKILKLKNNTDLRKCLAKNGFEFFKSNLTPKKLIKDFLSSLPF